MIIDLTPELFCILFFVFSIGGWFLHAYNNRIRIRYWLIPAFVAYLLLLISVTIVPIYIFDAATLERIRNDAGSYFVFYQIVPFKSIMTYFRESAIIQLIGNLVLLAPMVFFMEVFTKGRRSAKAMCAWVFLVSFSIELVQLIINYATGHPSRVADVDDLIVNTVGGIICLVVLRILEKAIRQKQGLLTISKKILYREM